MKTSRRRFLRSVGVTSAAAFAPWPRALRTALASPPLASVLNPRRIPKYVAPLVIPPAMSRTSALGGIDYYEIAVRQFTQQILPNGMPSTIVWSYGSANHPASFNYPAFTIEGRVDSPIRVKWINQLQDRHGRFLRHLFAIDPTLHWANPPGPRDMRPTFRHAPAPYGGPVPIITHLHGGHSAEEGDGYPEAWFLPNAENIPASYFRAGSFYEAFKQKFEAAWGETWEPGSFTAHYGNAQRATTLWYHDHALGITHLNVYAGPAGFYLLRGGDSDVPQGALPGPAPAVDDTPGSRYFEIPIVIQDRSFRHDGSLFYPSGRDFFDGFRGPYIPRSDISPIWNPEFFANTIVVNGRTWPYQRVEPRRYRLRLLNGCNSRFLLLKIVTNPLAARPAAPALPFTQIGSDGGFLPAPVQLSRLLIAPAERADVIVDFSGLPVGTELYVINEAPDEPFGGGEPGEAFEPADPGTTGQVMKFVVARLTGPDTSLPVDQLILPTLPTLPDATRIRYLSLNEDGSHILEGIGPRAALLGTVDVDSVPVPRPWEDDVTEQIPLGDTELWEIRNFTEDAHPIHIHQVQFQVDSRQALVTDEEGMPVVPSQLTGTPVEPEPSETGFKDTVIVYPGQVTRVKARFDTSGRFVWHCHILEHEDNEMMRPYIVSG